MGAPPMSDQVFQLASLAAYIVTAVAAMAAAYVGWVNRASIQEVHLTMNSRLDQLLSATEKLAMERGATEALAEDRVKRAKAKALVDQPSLSPGTLYEKHGPDGPQE